MSGNKHKHRKTFRLPGDCTIRVDKSKTLVNFKEVTVVKIAKKSTENESPVDSNIKSVEFRGEFDAALKPSTTNGSSVEVKKLPVQLACHINYNFDSSLVTFYFSDNEWDWSRISISGAYKGPLEDVHIPDEKFVYDNTRLLSLLRYGKFAQSFRLSLHGIERNVLWRQFTVKIAYMFLEDPNMQHFATEYTFNIPYFRKGSRFQRKFLGQYHADKNLVALFNAQFKQDAIYSESEQQLLSEIDSFIRHKSENTKSIVKSTEMVKLALNIEDLTDQMDLSDYDLDNVIVEGNMISSQFRIKYPMNNWPENLDEMSICLVPMSKHVPGQINKLEDSIYAQIDKIVNDEIHFTDKVRGESDEDKQNAVDLTKKYHFRFVPNRATYRSCFQALDMIKMRLLQDFFSDFEEAPYMNQISLNHFSRKEITEFEWYNKSIAENEEQKQAIMNIVNRTAFPFPYVVHGPPGTGKTSLIVEAIEQILKVNPNAKILVTAQSNSACDEVGERLLKNISINKIYRFYAPSLLNPGKGEKSKVLTKVSNLRFRWHDEPTEEEFKHFNVFIVTLMTCSRIIQLRSEDRSRNARRYNYRYTEPELFQLNHHFGYIFVDECAAATEPEALVPIVGLATDTRKVTASIVLLGDHKQLGPIVNSEKANRLGLDVSLMERILQTPKYRMDPITHQYDPKYVTQLLDNFRSHPAILQFSNVLFYDSKLRAKLTGPERLFGTNWNFLVNKNFPVMFHCNKTPSEFVRGGTSSYNMGEVGLVEHYVKMLLEQGVGGLKVEQEDIGIVSPYKAQLHKLKDRLRHVRKVDVGTAEYYQGREKKIVIISTVKSKDSIGFLKSERRLNVCITRAKSLLIVVGNAETLQRDRLWNTFMHYCKANGGVCGEEFELKRLTDDEEKVLAELNAIVEKRQTASDEIDEVEKAYAVNLDDELDKIEKRMKQLELLNKKMY